MLNPNEISAKRFDKAPVLGYRTDEVEAFLEQIAQDYAQLLSEKMELERKIEALADKLEEYRRDEDSLKSAVFEAQKLGSSIVRESKVKAERILQEANDKARVLEMEAQDQANALVGEAARKAEEITSSTDQRLASQQEAFEKLRAEVSSFKKRMMSTYKAHIELISSLPDPTQENKTIPAPPPAAPERLPSHPSGSEASVRSEAEPPASLPKEPVDPSTAPSEPKEEKAALSDVQEQPEKTASSTGTRVMPSINGNDMVDTASIAEAIQEESTKEMPKIRGDLKFGALKFGENYNLSDDRENNKRSRKK